jgi:purine-nucleoside phosphorylase
MSVPTPHLAAAAGDIADTVLLPGDPLRAKMIAGTYLEHAVCYNTVRNMLGFTGTYKGMRISVQGTGMGMPSISIYLTELLRFYKVHTAIRIGSAGALVESVKLRDVCLAISAHTTSAMNKRFFRGIDYAPSANFELLAAANRIAAEKSLRVHTGPILTSDAFYDDDLETFDLLAAHGTLAVEMETAALYTIAAREGARALSVVTVSDHLKTHEVMSSEERQVGFDTMVTLALETALATQK